MKEFGLVWDKESNPEDIVTRVNNHPPYLKELKKLQVGNGETEQSHVLIEGDNFASLTAMQDTHKNGVDVIIVDPPYNTGHAFTYHDKRKNDNDNYAHSEWLTFMDRRMRLAKNLLKTNGIVYCFIGHDELANLTLMMDQIFGHKNRASIISRITRKGKIGLAKNIVAACDYILVYTKNEDTIKTLGEQYKEEDGYTRTFIKAKNIQGVATNRYWLKCPDGSFIIPKGDNYPENIEEFSCAESINSYERCWTYVAKTTKEKYDVLNFKKKKNSFFVNEKLEQSEWTVEYSKNLEGIKAVPNFLIDTKFENEQASIQLRELFGGEKVFDFPKPTALIEYLIKITNKSKDITVLDFFAGSGSTGHAVLNLNANDGGIRKSIMCSINDPRDTVDICTEVTYERLKIVTKKYISEKYKNDKEPAKNLFNEQLTLDNSKLTSNLDGFPPTLKYFKVEFAENNDPLTILAVKGHNENTI